MCESECVSVLMRVYVHASEFVWTRTFACPRKRVENLPTPTMHIFTVRKRARVANIPKYHNTKTPKHTHHT